MGEKLDYLEVRIHNPKGFIMRSFNTIEETIEFLEKLKKLEIEMP